uniref:Pentatricopeptide repeat protein n=1 Tax=Schrenkiella parvula TaxID=98039 RepID=E5F730_9BRAS|nr:pentatricopeptide repeat protein [Schrenkiella parvula]
MVFLTVVRNGGRIRQFCSVSVSLLEKPVEQEARVSNQVVPFDTNYQLRNLINSGNLRDARQVFDRMPHRDIFSWTAIIQGYVAATNYDEALILFSAMRFDPRVSADTYVLSVALKACGQSSNISYGESLHAFAEKTSLLSSVFVGSALLDMYKRTGKIDKSCRVFSEMPFRNSVTWTTIITALVQAGRHKEGLMYFSQMSKGLSDTFTFAIALKACACLRQVKYGKEIHTHVIVKGFGAILWVANSLFTMYTECGKMQDGLRLFESMSERDVVSWTSLITAYSRIGQEEKAVNTFLHMRNSEVPSNEQTFASMFAACASLSRLVWGEQLHGNVFSIGLGDSLSVSNSMMKMYSTMECRDIISWSTIIGKSGPKPTDFALASLLSVSGNMAVLEQGRQNPTIRASKVFEEIDRADIVSLTAMINGYAEHGESKEAIDPDTFDLGFHYFNLMQEKYNISPAKEHYRLSDAEKMIDEMPCTVKRDIERGRRAAERILELDPTSSTALAAIVRKNMKSKGVIKEPGWSSILIKDRVSAFASGGRSNPQCEDIYNILELVVRGAEAHRYNAIKRRFWVNSIL